MTVQTRVVQNIIEVPGPGHPYRPGDTVSIDLSDIAFANGTTEKIGRRYADIDAHGFWSAELEVNVDLDPPGTYYTVREARGVVRGFEVEAGDGPVWLRDCLSVDPLSHPPVVLAGSGNLDGGSAAAVYAPDQTVLDGGGAAA